MADTKLQVVHALFRYVDADGIERFAMNRDVVDFPAAEAKRGLDLGALVKPGASEEPAATEEPLGAFPADDEAAQDAWIGQAKVDDVTAYASEHPDSKAALIAAEERRGDKARKTLLEALAK